MSKQKRDFIRETNMNERKVEGGYQENYSIQTVHIRLPHLKHEHFIHLQ